MGTTLDKTQLLTELHQENANWQALLDAIGEAHMTQPEVAGGWSIKDIVAHLMLWRQRTVRRLQALRNQETEFTPPWPPELQEDDDINAWIYAANRDRPLADVLADSRRFFQQLVEVLEALPEDSAQILQQFGLEEGEAAHGSMFFAHFHEEHEPDMRAWLDKVKSHTS